jgi:hypothetical protein
MRLIHSGLGGTARGFFTYFVVGMALLFFTPQLVKLAFCGEQKIS